MHCTLDHTRAHTVTRTHHARPHSSSYCTCIHNQGSLGDRSLGADRHHDERWRRLRRHGMRPRRVRYAPGSLAGRGPHVHRRRGGPACTACDAAWPRRGARRVLLQIRAAADGIEARSDSAPRRRDPAAGFDAGQGLGPECVTAWAHRPWESVLPKPPGGSNGFRARSAAGAAVAHPRVRRRRGRRRAACGLRLPRRRRPRRQRQCARRASKAHTTAATARPAAAAPPTRLVRPRGGEVVAARERARRPGTRGVARRRARRVATEQN